MYFLQKFSSPSVDNQGNSNELRQEEIRLISEIYFLNPAALALHNYFDREDSAAEKTGSVHKSKSKRPCKDFCLNIYYKFQI